MKKIISLILAAVMLMALSVNSFALLSKGTLGENAEYTFNSNTGELIIEPVDPSKESSIGGITFRAESKIKKVVIEGVTEIGSTTFENCRNLLEVKIENGTKYIDEQAFFFCKSLWKVDLPETLEKIGEEAFSNCKITTLIFRGDKPEMMKDCFGGLGANENACVYTNGWEEVLPGSSISHVIFRSSTSSASALGSGSIWIVAVVAVAVVAVAVIIAKKKKKAAADVTEGTAETEEKEE